MASQIDLMPNTLAQRDGARQDFLTRLLIPATTEKSPDRPCVSRSATSRRDATGAGCFTSKRDCFRTWGGLQCQTKEGFPKGFSRQRDSSRSVNGASVRVQTYRLVTEAKTFAHESALSSRKSR
jgi:hypothetical protein